MSCQLAAASLRCTAAPASPGMRGVQSRAQRGSLQPLQRATAARPAAAVRRRQLCRATAEKEGTQQAAAGQPQVPDTPPTPTGAAEQQQQQRQASSSPEPTTMSIEEIQQRAAALRQQKAAGDAKEGLVEGVTEEVGLIKWPSPVKAALQTVLVIGIVAGTAALLLAINSVLTEVSTAILG